MESKKMKASSLIPSIDFALECITLCKLVNEVESKESCEEHGYETQFFKQNKPTSKVVGSNFSLSTMMVTLKAGRTNKYVVGKNIKDVDGKVNHIGVVFGVDEIGMGYDWEKHIRMPMVSIGKDPTSSTTSQSSIKSADIHSVINAALFSPPSDGGERIDSQIIKHLNDALIRHSQKTLSITVIGHSIGGAIATIFAAYLAVHKPILDVALLTFGCPRVGGDKFQKWIDAIDNLTVWRFVKSNDVVCTVPSLTIGYRHVGHIMMLDQSDGASAYFYNNNRPDDDDKYVEPPEFLTPFTAVKSPIDDHEVDDYLNFLLEKSKEDPKKFYASKFKTKSGVIDDDDEVTEEVGMIEQITDWMKHLIY